MNQQGLSISRLFGSGTLFITIAANIGEVAIAREEVACPDSVVALTCKPNVDMLWLYQALQPCKSRLEATASQNAQSNLNLEKLNPFLVVSPTEPGERGAIGAFLTDIDGAIFGLTAKWQKAQALKQGMMQELLTGRTRLI